MPYPNESSILPKFLEKSDPEVARPAFSTWPVQKSQPKAFEMCASIQIHQSTYRDRWQFKTTTLPSTRRFVWSRYADCRIWMDAHNSNAFGCAPPYNILYISHLSLSMQLLQQFVIIVCFCLFQVLTNILFKGSYVCIHVKNRFLRADLTFVSCHVTVNVQRVSSVLRVDPVPPFSFRVNRVPDTLTGISRLLGIPTPLLCCGR